jgi:hypothetical protein
MALADGWSPRDCGGAEGSDYGSGPAKPNDWKASIKAAEELLAAVKVGDVAAVTELLENGVNPNIIDHESNTPLHLAAARGLKAVRFPCMASNSILSINTVRGSCAPKEHLLLHAVPTRRRYTPKRTETY